MVTVGAVQGAGGERFRVGCDRARRCRVSKALEASCVAVNLMIG